MSNEEFGITGTDCGMFYNIQYQLSADAFYCEASTFVSFHCGYNDSVFGYYGTSSIQQQKVLVWLP